MTTTLSATETFRACFLPGRVLWRGRVVSPIGLVVWLCRLRDRAERRGSVERPPPKLGAEIAGDDAGRNVAGPARDGAARMAGGAGHVEIGDGCAIAEMIVHDLLGVEC